MAMMITLFILILCIQASSCLVAVRQPQQPLAAKSQTGKPIIVWFRDHALRVKDNESLTSAVQEAISLSAPVMPVYLWTAPIDERTGGKAKDVFVAQALKGLNETLNGSLSLGLVVDDVATELIEICQRSSATQVFYLKSHNEHFESKLQGLLKEAGVTPRPFGGAFSLMDYSVKNVPWKDIILEHPWRSPLIPFVHYAL